MVVEWNEPVLDLKKQDIRRAIHPSYVEGQIQGGATQGIGWALNEEYIYDKNGRLDNSGFLDYRAPVASDLPMIEAPIRTRLREVHDPDPSDMPTPA